MLLLQVYQPSKVQQSRDFAFALEQLRKLFQAFPKVVLAVRKLADHFVAFVQGQNARENRAIQ